MEISTKFQPGDNVWIMHDNKPVEGKVVLMVIRCNHPLVYYVVYTLNVTIHKESLFDVYEKKVYKSKEELLASL